MVFRGGKMNYKKRQERKRARKKRELKRRKLSLTLKKQARTPREKFQECRPKLKDNQKRYFRGPTCGIIFGFSGSGDPTR